ncbi:MAG: hypothetical protein JWO95_68 [Verrucomicrobiales bacterium]|nr:hypothetical protein [Verrucomicrobiales bacterium]
MRIAARPNRQRLKRASFALLGCWLCLALTPLAFSKTVDGHGDSRKASAETNPESAREIHESGGPICSVKREVYVPSPKTGVAAQVAVSYLGKGLRRREIHAFQSKSDLAERVKVRFSDDNGRNWTPLAPLDSGPDALRQGTNSMEELLFAINYDPNARRTIQMVFQRIFMGDASQALHRFWKGEKAFYDHGMYRLSRDDGRSWTKERQLEYESGAAFDPRNWTNPSYLNSNQMYGSYEVTILRNGEIAYPAVVPVPYEDEEDRKMAASFPKYVSATGSVGGVTCFIGKWNKRKDDYDWTCSKPVFVPRRVSTRGMSEPVIAELADGRLLLEMRGSNAGLDPVKFPGRRWMSLSSDHGRNWTPITDLRYDTGEPFYAPSTMARFIRSSKTGMLYWIGNISRKPAEGNLPRYPLYIAEVDEKIPALKKNTMTIIDDRAPEDTAAVQFSNFSLLENRQTRDLEIYLTRLGENAGSNFSANAYKYTLKIR